MIWSKPAIYEEDPSAFLPEKNGMQTVVKDIPMYSFALRWGQHLATVRDAGRTAEFWDVVRGWP